MAATLKTLYDDVTRQITAAGIDDARTEASHLVSLALAVDRALLLSEKALSLADIERVQVFTAQRIGRMPLDRIVGSRGFYGLEFGLNAATLSPRADTETLVDTALKALPDARRILDLGTGTGCILCALLHELPEAQGVGIDASAEAIEQAKANAAALKLEARAEFIVSDWFQNAGGRFDLIVSNPPYIPSAVIAMLDPEVRNHDPHAALDGGADGLDDYRAIVAGAETHIAPGGALLLEIGQGQEKDVAAIAAEAGWRLIEQVADLGGIIRVLHFRRA